VVELEKQYLLQNYARYPLVLTRWEGVELMNYSPFIYAFEQENIAVTGEGTFSVHAKSASGGGAFTFTGADGTTFRGTWSVKGLIAFQPYGCGVISEYSTALDTSHLRERPGPASSAHRISHKNVA